jgi:thymidylate kinase
MRGFFVVFEGIAGANKTRCARELARVCNGIYLEIPQQSDSSFSFTE